MIELLPQETIEQIAAGEVIERPVSVVKELVENAIDAGASEISVDIVHGGKEKIAVYDNGSGIEPEDMEKAFLRHATSKIKSFSDLYDLHSLGFRGEALPSIISVARVKARSRTKKHQEGLELVYEAGKVTDRHPVAMPVGTQMEVEDLFQLLPVRQKFLKSDLAEWKQISDLLYPLAVSRSDLSFRVVRDGQLIFQTRGENSLDENLLVLFGSSYYEALTPLEGANEDYRLSGRISNNTYYRGNRNLQYIFMNGRLIEDEQIRKAVEEEYKSIIPNGRFPAFQLFIEGDPALIDVNIHPSKKQISFRHREALDQLIHETVHKALFQSVEIPKAKPEEESHKNIFSDMTTEESYRRILNAYAWHGQGFADGESPYDKLFQKKKEQKEGEADHPEASDHLLTEDLQEEDFSAENLDAGDQEPVSSSTGNLEEKPAASQTGAQTAAEEKAYPWTAAEQEADASAAAKKRADAPAAEENLTGDMSGANFEQRVMASEDEEENPLTRLLHRAYIGTLFNTYLLFEDDQRERVYMIDQHAAHERINYERFMKQLKTGAVVSQKLLTPLWVQLDDSQIELLKRRASFFREMGYDVDSIGENRVAIRAVPTLFKSSSDEMIFRSLLDMNVSQLDSFDAIIDQMAMKACKASVKQGDRLSVHEVFDLIRQLGRCDYPYTCPHGRPTLVEVDKAWFEKLFMRRK